MASRESSDLIGTWRMLTWQREFLDTHELVDALGPNPVGYVSYSHDGRVHALVVRADRPCPASLPPSLPEKADLFDSMLAYAGTYTAFDDRVIHRLDASWNQAWTDTDQVRFYRLTEGQLQIWSAPAADPYSGRMVVHRITFEKWKSTT